jgi:hypothetical protein
LRFDRAWSNVPIRLQFFSLTAIFFNRKGESTKFVAAAHHAGWSRRLTIRNAE